MLIQKIAFTGAFLLMMGNINAQTKTQIIAHRGYWKTEGCAENSIAALDNANKIKVYGSEFDVYISADSVLVINHNSTTTDHHLKIENTRFEELKKEKLSNGETLPTLEAYLKKGKKCKNIKLIVELKPHSTKEKEDLLTAQTVAMVKKMKLQDKVEYITFSLNMVKELIKTDPNAKVYYLRGDLSPKQLKELGCAGLDYEINLMKKNENWFSEAKELGLKINLWTVNKEEDMRYCIEKGVDYITTNEPVLGLKLTN